MLGRTSLSLLTLLLPGQLWAIGLGDLRSQPVLGESLRLEVSLLGVDRQHIDASCFRLAPPASDDLPSLRRASFTLRREGEPILEIRSDLPLREPVMQMTIQVGCGHEISRTYMLMASPPQPAVAVPSAAGRERAAMVAPAGAGEPRAVLTRHPQTLPPEAPARLLPRKASQPRERGGRDRLLLSGSEFAVYEPSLRLATELLGVAAAKEAERDILRLEYRMLMALHEQAISQMAAAEKLRNMEGALIELQSRAADFAHRVEQDGAGPRPGAPADQVAPPAKGAEKPAPAVPRDTGARRVTEDTPWSVYGLLLGLLLGLGGWIGWRRYREAKENAVVADLPLAVPEVRVDPKREEEREEPGGVDLPVEPAAMGMPMQVDIDLLGQGHPEAALEPVETAKAQVAGPALSINATTLDEHFEANPVMELADIMLSFGRVKGAAQALQEFIDRNPQEALQPWIRLMDVYRMAGMRTEFEQVARNLNQHFNVEVQSWEGGGANGGDLLAENVTGGQRPQSLEDMPRLMNAVVDLWESGDVVGYLYQLLRDNRGGQRQGFALPVVDDILFLIELKETANRME
ncbi:MAG: FimV family protein [Azonexus sp.]